MSMPFERRAGSAKFGPIGERYDYGSAGQVTAPVKGVGLPERFAPIEVPSAWQVAPEAGAAALPQAVEVVMPEAQMPQMPFTPAEIA